MIEPEMSDGDKEELRTGSLLQIFTAYVYGTDTDLGGEMAMVWLWEAVTDLLELLEHLGTPTGRFDLQNVVRNFCEQEEIPYNPPPIDDEGE